MLEVTSKQGAAQRSAAGRSARAFATGFATTKKSLASVATEVTRLVCLIHKGPASM